MQGGIGGSAMGGGASQMSQGQQLFAARPKLMSRAGPMAAGGKNLDMYSPEGFSTAMTQDPYREQ